MGFWKKLFGGSGASKGDTNTGESDLPPEDDPRYKERTYRPKNLLPDDPYAVRARMLKAGEAVKLQYTTVIEGMYLSTDPSGGQTGFEAKTFEDTFTLVVPDAEG